MTVHKAEAAAVDETCALRFLKSIALVLILGSLSLAQDIPEDELDVRINSYFDNFRVTVIYPQVSITKKLGDGTSISGRYLSDIISSASMRANFQVDGVTSATTRKEGGADNNPDEWRNEFGAGITQKLIDGVLSLNGSYSIEHDYSSKTITGSLSYPFAKKNTVLQFSFVKNFDKVFPQIRTWTKDRNTASINAGLTQILSKNIITQLDGSYTTISGYQLDGYQVVRIIENDSTYRTVEPVHPDFRVRRAIGMRTNFGLTKNITLQLGYRYYWDSWDVKSHTISAKISSNFSPVVSGSFEFRHYLQTRAFFFKPVYTQVEQYMSVEGQLNSGYSDEAELNLVLRGSKKYDVPFINNDKLSLTGSLGFYRRYTDSPDWFTDYQILYAYTMSVGLRYNF